MGNREGRVELATPSPQRMPGRTHRTAVIGGLVAAVCATNAWILTGGGGPGPLPWIGASAGFLMALGLPAWMLSQKVDWRSELPSERLIYSVITAILGLLIVGLVINTVLPHVGISRPLDRVPVLLAIDAWCGGLALWRRALFRPALRWPNIDRLNGFDLSIGSLSALCVPLAVLGANRLNNGAGGTVTVIMLILAALVFTLMFGKREHLNPGTLPFAIYCIGLAMLLMTSLRGWYVTGHDIQSEFRVFELTKARGEWNISFDRDAYNSCLSITILPTMLWQVIRVNDPYIYKFWFQLLFALCPVAVYCVSRRHTSRATAIIAVMFFVAFPTYSTDMPFLNRQEIAFLFVAACMMVVTNVRMSKREIHLWIGIFSIGVVLSHYSTSYVFFGTLAIGWTAYKAWAIFHRPRNRPAVTRPERALRTRLDLRSRWIAPSMNLTPAISFMNVAIVFIAIFLWNGVATHTSSGFISIISQAIQSLRGGAGNTSASGTLSIQQAATAYQQTTLTETLVGRASGLYLSQELLDQYPIHFIVSLGLTPVTAAGRLLDAVGINVSTLNSIVRSVAARLLQLLVVVGLLAAIFSRMRRESRSFVELIALGCGALAIVGLQVVMPILTVDYGILRAFLQALIVFGPFVAIGCITIGRPLGDKWSHRLAYALAGVFFLSLSGVIPQLLGGYPAQLALNNSGQYYDIYYMHPQDVSAIDWMQANIPANLLAGVQSEVESNRYNATLPGSFVPVSTINDIYPTLLRKNSYVYLGYTNVVKDQATFSYGGQMVTYTYPIGLLQSTDDLLYSSNGAQVYR